jgi:hypothetical protein
MVTTCWLRISPRACSKFAACFAYRSAEEGRNERSTQQRGERLMSSVIPKEDLLEHVLISAISHIASRLPGTEIWVKAQISREAITVFDINGEPLFYDYPVKEGPTVLGHIRASASKILGAPVVASELGPRKWDQKTAVEKLMASFKQKFPELTVKETKLVCYSYPKLGIMFQATDKTGALSRHIFDVADLSPIPEKRDRPKIEGAYAWSFYESLTSEMRRERTGRYEQIDRRRIEIPTVERRAMAEAATLGGYVATQPAWQGTYVAASTTKLLQFCTHYAYNESRSHHCFILHGQQKNDGCALATCQMILCYYRYYYTQDQIAPALGYAPGGCPSDQSPGYEKLSCNHIDATYDTSPTWEKARNQIDALHPLKSGINGHARACAGYSYNTVTGVNQLYLYDPWPPNIDIKLGGAVSWEDWSSVTHTNYVFTRLTCP